MNRRAALAAAPVLWLLLAAAPAALAADDLFQAIPDNTLGFVVVNRLAETSAKVVDIGNHLRVPAVNPLAVSKARAGIATGLDEQGSMAIVVVPGASENADPAVIMLLPVSDYGKFIAQLHPTSGAPSSITPVTLWDTKMLVENVGHYALFVEPEHRAVLAHAAGPKRVVSDELADWRTWLAEKDVAGVVTSAGIQLIVKLAKRSGAEIQAAQAAGVMDFGEFDWIRFYLKPEFLAVAEPEVRSLALGVNWDSRGALRTVGRCAFWANGRAAKLCRALGPGVANGLAGLPAGQFAIGASVGVPDVARGWFVDQAVKAENALAKNGRLKNGDVDKMAKLLRPLSGRISQCSLLLQADSHAESLLSQLFIRQQVDDAGGFLDDFEKCLDGYNAIAKKSGDDLPVVQKKRTAIEGHATVEAVLDCGKLSGDDDPFGGGAESLGKVVGPEGKLVVDVAAAGKQQVAIGCINQKLLRRALQVAAKTETGLADDKEVSTIIAMLPGRALLMIVARPQGVISLMRGTGVPLPVFRATPPVGLAITTVDADLEAHLVLAPEILSGAYAYFTGAMNNFSWGQ